MYPVPVVFSSRPHQPNTESEAVVLKEYGDSCQIHCCIFAHVEKTYHHFISYIDRSNKCKFEVE